MDAERENKRLPLLKREDVKFSELRDGRKGISIDEGQLWLGIWHDGALHFQLYTADYATPLTSSFTLESPTQLKYSRKAQYLRELLSRHYANPSDILEWITIELQRHLSEWLEKPKDHGRIKASDASKASARAEAIPPEEAVKQELEALGATQIHPLIDYTDILGLTLGSFLGTSNQTLIFVKEKPIAVRNGRIEIKEEPATNISVSCQGRPELQPVHLKQMLNLFSSAFSGEKIEFPSKSKVFGEVLQGISLYWYHSNIHYHILVACWIIATYFHPMFTHFPILNLQGQRETGKTTLLQILSKICWNPTPLTTALRGAALFRTIEQDRVTYIVDITGLNPQSEEFRDIIDVIETGTEKGGAVPRVDRETLDHHYYKTYGPKAIASRYELPFTVKAVRIITEKAPSAEYSMRRHFLDSDGRWPRIVDLLLRAAIKYWPEVAEAYRSLQPTQNLTGRPFNYWSPILAVCRVFAPQHYGDLLSLAEELAGQELTADRLSEVEDAVLTVLMAKEVSTSTMLLKELTEEVNRLLPEPAAWQTVRSAVENLGIIKLRKKTRRGVSLELNVEKARKLAEQRGITQETSEERRIQQLKPEAGSIDEVCQRSVACADGRQASKPYGVEESPFSPETASSTPILPETPPEEKPKHLKRRRRWGRMTLQEFYVAFREAKPEGFTRDEFLEFARKSGYSREEAELLLRRDDGVDFFRVADDSYVWRRGR